MPHALCVQVARAAVDAARERVELGQPVENNDVVRDAQSRMAALEAQLLRPVINATGVLLHTNLGRAPLGADTIAAMAAGSGATNLEYRLAEGIRGSRHEHAGHLLAAAQWRRSRHRRQQQRVPRCCSCARWRRPRGHRPRGTGRDRRRIPRAEIMAETGARLVEVGTTNRTRPADYEGALTERTALLLKVHAPNYRMIGFVSSTPVSQLAALGRRWSSMPVWVSSTRARHGCRLDPNGCTTNPARQCLEAGAAPSRSPATSCSADRRPADRRPPHLVDRCKAHLARVRADKATLAGMQQVARISKAMSPRSRSGAWRPHRSTSPREPRRSRAS
jgi:L-seryl-tRNA(Ser) seleniumtransferase